MCNVHETELQRVFSSLSFHIYLSIPYIIDKDKVREDIYTGMSNI